MLKSNYNVIGVMSGTSLDGLDLCYVHFEFNHVWSFKIIEVETILYNITWRDKLKDSILLDESELDQLDKEYTIYLAQMINSFIERFNIKNIDAVCSHGHTVFHKPNLGYTKQIGNLPLLSARLNQIIVCDFRIQDVEFNGQGAPLVPIGDKYLFYKYDYCLNLGGFANVSFDRNNERIAFDICPVNIVLNHYANLLNMMFDEDGKIARTGNINYELLNDLNKLEFYLKSHPKSLGLEWVKFNILPLIESYNILIKDVLRTFVEHVSIQITNIITKKNDATVLVTGGGVYNSFLMELIREKSNCKIVTPSKQIIEFKEALIFGLLGVLKLREQVNCLRSVTGALKDHSSGNIFHP